ncbi:MAG: PepSY-like domain-containing protein [Saprospiraceae bacterium]|nr:PepSY-like domain-containing protein [Candidatus Opimibacter iunctus]
MIRLLLIVFAFCLTEHIGAQTIKERDVPGAVTSKVKALYPDVTKIKWEMEDGMYEASFMTGDKETSVMVSSQGMLVQTETEIEVAALPKEAAIYIMQNNPGNAIQEATKRTDVYGVVSYEAELKNMEYVFDATGKLLTEEKVDGNKEKRND